MVSMNFQHVGLAFLNFMICFTVSGKEIANQLTKTTIDCDLTLGASVFVPFDVTKEREFEAELLKNEKLKVTITNLLSNEPMLVANQGSSPLQKISTSDLIYLIETTGVGNLNVWTYFPKGKKLILSKQYNLFRPYSLLLAGKCEER
jgi:hypothetical protein